MFQTVKSKQDQVISSQIILLVSLSIWQHIYLFNMSQEHAQGQLQNRGMHKCIIVNAVKVSKHWKLSSSNMQCLDRTSTHPIALYSVHTLNQHKTWSQNYSIFCVVKTQEGNCNIPCWQGHQISHFASIALYVLIKQHLNQLLTNTIHYNKLKYEQTKSFEII